MACDARWPRAERGGQMSLYGCLSAFADVQPRLLERLKYYAKLTAQPPQNLGRFIHHQPAYLQ